MHSWQEMVNLNKIHLLADQNNKYPVTQYTGRNDKNGIEIYEGDICVNESGRIARIIYLDSGACFDAVALNEKGDSKGFEPQMWSYRIRVIANIYQNPELLEGK
jgi:uncharacterized phage protein (TIGR01671 family)